MKRFRTSELIFIFIGLLLMIASAWLLKSNVSLVKAFNIHLSPGDPFQASYYVAPQTPTPIPAPSPTPNPLLRVQVANANAAISESSKLSLYLLAPPNQAILTRAKHTKDAKKVTFKFEVYPKNTPLTFELKLKDAVIQSQTMVANANGVHEITIEIPKAGVYQWDVKATDFTSELRTFVYRE